MAKKEKENKHTDLEVVKVGYANGISPNFPLTDKQKEKMIYGQVDTLKCHLLLHFLRMVMMEL